MDALDAPDIIDDTPRSSKSGGAKKKKNRYGKGKPGKAPSRPATGKGGDRAADDEEAAPAATGAAAAAGAVPAASSAAASVAPSTVADERTVGLTDPNRTCTGVLVSRPTARDIKIASFTLTLHGQELIQDTMIELTIGRRYGLIGSNGAGKSTFLRALACREVPIPPHVDIFLLHQEAEPSDRTALEAVVDEVQRELHRLEALEAHLMSQPMPDSEQLEDVGQRIEGMDPANFEVKAGKILHGLGFSKEMMNRATKDMSGGWRMRVALARALFVRPTLLLLDEPTNHLDLEACVWLEEYLRTSYNRCLIVVSHSQDFLNGVCTHIIDITHKKQLQEYTGNYDTFVRTKQELEVNQQKQYEKEQADIKHIRAFIASCGTYSNLVRQAKSKQKIIDKMEARGLTEPVVKFKRFSFSFNDCEKLPPPVMSFANVSFSYDGDLRHALYRGLEFGVDCDSRIALVGPNGAGKSTLLKLMVGELVPTQGSVTRHMHLRIARYHQHSVDQLDMEAAPLDFMRDLYKHLEYDVERWRQVIGRFGITGTMQVTPMKMLSDGQHSRVVFAMLALENPNMLLLDEPTNHLDMDCIDSLADAINGFNGGVVLVSHDFRLINQVAKQIWVCDNKSVQPWSGDIQSYKDHLRASMGF